MLIKYFNNLEITIYINEINRLKNIDKFILRTKKVKRLYFGEEFCEEKIPSLSEIKDIYHYTLKNKISFTYISGYLTNKGLHQQYDICEYFNNQSEKIEVIFNDFGLLRLLSKEFKNLKPVLGRLLVKVPRMPRYTLKLPSPYPHLVTSPRLWENQLRVLSTSNLSLLPYRNFLKKYKIERVECDIVPQGINFKKEWDFKYSLYTPWSYVTGSRTCDIAGLSHPEKSRFVTMDKCLKPCKKFYIKFYSDEPMLPLIQEGNSVFFNNQNLIPEYIKTKNFDRIVFEYF